MSIYRVRLATVSLLGILAAGPAFAQGAMSGHKPVVGTAAPAAKEAPPPALPGSRAEPMEAAPPSKVSVDMPPNDALFDAINRGDLSAAKDAIGRGADPNSHNVLGLTPLDLSVDLGRNAITFILLSMRNPEPVATASTAPAPGPRAKAATKVARRGGAHGPALDHAPTVQTVLARPSAFSDTARKHAAAQAPRRFAADGGTPNPSAGFLGFGSTPR